MNRTRRKVVTATALVATVLVANYVTSRYGKWPVGFGLTATAGTYFAGAAFVLRDSLQDLGGKRWVIATIAAGALLSLLIGAPGIALASAVAFALSELADFAVYTPLRSRGYVRAALASNAVGIVVDTGVFLSLAATALRAFDPGFTVAGAFWGQLLGKFAVTLVVVATVALRNRRPVTV